jgi:hypothetical protein
MNWSFTVHHAEHIVAAMNQPAQHPFAPSEVSAATLRISLAIFAAIDLGLAVFMAVAPHAFYKTIGPFGASNPHYVRDVATFYFAVGIALALAVSRPSWRAPALAISAIQYAAHSLNHLIDIANAHPAWTGYFDFFSLLAGTVVLTWLWRVAASADREPAVQPGARPHPTPQRSPT